MKFSQLGRSFFRKMVQIRSNFATTCTIKGTRGAKLPIDATFSGRSMVEMLGVLAIIGVLSVGAIAGYSKAMMKYKLNKQAESLNLLINYSLQNLSTLGPQQDTLVEHADILYKLNLIPDGIQYNQSRLYDIFNNHIRVYTQAKNSTYNYGISIRNTSGSTMDKEVCRNIATVAKENKANLYQLVSYNNEEQSHFGTLYGDNYCTSNVKCLKDLTISDIDLLCTNKTDIFYILWN